MSKFRSRAGPSESTRESVFEKPPIKLDDDLYEIHSGPKNPSVEIVFFHGFEIEDSDDLYWKDWLSVDRSHCWLGSWLVEDFPEARILSVRYDSSLTHSSTGRRMDLSGVSADLATTLVRLSGRVGRGECPVILVGHSVGGLVMKQLLVTVNSFCSDSREQSERDLFGSFLKKVRALFFYATPHAGSELGSDTIRNAPSSSLFLKSLEMSAFETSILHEKFLNLRSIYKWRVSGLGELFETKLVTKLGRNCFHGIVVEEASASKGMDASFTMIPSHHMNICKPDAKTSLSFSCLSDFIKDTMHQEKNCEQQCPGLPRSLEIMGQRLHGQDENGVIWEGAIDDFEKTCLTERGQTIVVPEEAHDPDNLQYLTRSEVGLAPQVDELKRLLMKDQKVAIVGCGGMGKTTLAKKLFNSINNPENYDYTGFFLSVKAQWAIYKIVDFRYEILGNLCKRGKKLNREDLKWSDLKGQRVLLVLDDVNSQHHLPDFMDEFAKESRLIVTSRRDSDYMDEFAKKHRSFLTFSLAFREDSFLKGFSIYHIERLDPENSRKLFCTHAFGGNPRDEALQKIQDKLIKKCDGLPLALEAVGSVLYEREYEIWEELLRKIEDLTMWEMILRSYEDILDRYLKREFWDPLDMRRDMLLNAVVASLTDEEYPRRQLEEAVRLLASIGRPKNHKPDNEDCWFPSKGFWGPYGQLPLIVPGIVEKLVGLLFQNENPNFQAEAAWVFSELSESPDDEWREKLFRLLIFDHSGMLDRLVASLSNEKNMFLQVATARLLASITRWKNHKYSSKILRFPGMLQKLTSSLLNHKNPDLQVEAATVFCNVSGFSDDGSGVKRFNYQSGLEVLTTSLLQGEAGCLGVRSVEFLGHITRSNNYEFCTKIFWLPGIMEKLAKSFSNHLNPHLLVEAAQVFCNITRLSDDDFLSKHFNIRSVLNTLVASLSAGQNCLLRAEVVRLLASIARSRNYELCIKTFRFPGIVENLSSSLLERENSVLQVKVAEVFCNLSELPDDEFREELLNFPSMLDTLVASLSDKKSSCIQVEVARLLANMTSSKSYKLCSKIILFPGMMEALKHSLSKDQKSDLQVEAARVLRNTSRLLKSESIDLQSFKNLLRLLSQNSKYSHRLLGLEATKALSSLLGETDSIEYQILISSYTGRMRLTDIMLSLDKGYDRRLEAARLLRSLSGSQDHVIEERITHFDDMHLIKRLAGLLSLNPNSDLQVEITGVFSNLLRLTDDRGLTKEAGLTKTGGKVMEKLVNLLSQNLNPDLQLGITRMFASLSAVQNPKLWREILVTCGLLGSLESALSRTGYPSLQVNAATVFANVSAWEDDLLSEEIFQKSPDMLKKLMGLLSENANPLLQVAGARTLANFTCTTADTIRARLVHFPGLMIKMANSFIQQGYRLVQVEAARAFANLTYMKGETLHQRNIRSPDLLKSLARSSMQKSNANLQRRGARANEDPSCTEDDAVGDEKFVVSESSGEIWALEAAAAKVLINWAISEDDTFMGGQIFCSGRLVVWVGAESKSFDPRWGTKLNERIPQLRSDIQSLGLTAWDRQYNPQEIFGLYNVRADQKGIDFMFFHAKGMADLFGVGLHHGIVSVIHDAKLQIKVQEIESKLWKDAWMESYGGPFKPIVFRMLEESFSGSDKHDALARKGPREFPALGDFKSPTGFGLLYKEWVEGFIRSLQRGDGFRNDEGVRACMGYRNHEYGGSKTGKRGLTGVDEGGGISNALGVDTGNDQGRQISNAQDVDTGNDQGGDAGNDHGNGSENGQGGDGEDDLGQGSGDNSKGEGGSGDNSECQDGSGDNGGDNSKRQGGSGDGNDRKSLPEGEKDGKVVVSVTLLRSSAYFGTEDDMKYGFVDLNLESEVMNDICGMPPANPRGTCAADNQTLLTGGRGTSTSDAHGTSTSDGHGTFAIVPRGASSSIVPCLDIEFTWEWRWKRIVSVEFRVDYGISGTHTDDWAWCQDHLQMSFSCYGDPTDQRAKRILPDEVLSDRTVVAIERTETQGQSNNSGTACSATPGISFGVVAAKGQIGKQSAKGTTSEAKVVSSRSERHLADSGFSLFPKTDSHNPHNLCWEAEYPGRIEQTGHWEENKWNELRRTGLCGNVDVAVRGTWVLKAEETKFQFQATKQLNKWTKLSGKEEGRSQELFLPAMKTLSLEKGKKARVAERRQVWQKLTRDLILDHNFLRTGLQGFNRLKHPEPYYIDDPLSKVSVNVIEEVVSQLLIDYYPDLLDERNKLLEEGNEADPLQHNPTLCPGG